jgi:hypothetical protein
VGKCHFIEGGMSKQVCVNVLRELVKASAEKLWIKEHFSILQRQRPKIFAAFCKMAVLVQFPPQKKVNNTPPQSTDFQCD